MLACTFAMSRSFSGLSVVSFKMAKNTGLAATFSDMAVKGRVKITMLVYLVLIGGVMIYLDAPLGMLAILAAMIDFLAYRHMAYKKFGGITGDLAGFFLQTCELLMAAAVILGARFLR